MEDIYAGMTGDQAVMGAGGTRRDGSLGNSDSSTEVLKRMVMSPNMQKEQLYMIMHS